MLTTLVITDVTRMGGDRVCIAGIGPANTCIRPVLPSSSVRESHLRANGAPLIFPRSKVQFDLLPIPVTPPHIEDREFDPASILGQGVCDDEEWEATLLASCSASVDRLYDGFLQEPRYVLPGSLTRSLGTVTNQQYISLSLGNSSFRLSFIDAVGEQYQDVQIVDINFRNYGAEQMRRYGSVDLAETRIASVIRNARRTYLRLGLARAWAADDGRYPAACWLQVTGIYTFPDYQGRWGEPS